MKILSYKDLIVWKKSILLVKEVYKLTENFPKSEVYGLTSQLRRAAVSIPSNIAEGYGRRTVKGYSHAYTIAFGSALELETQLIIAKELNFISDSEFNTLYPLLEEVLKMLNKMTSSRKS